MCLGALLGKRPRVTSHYPMSHLRHPDHVQLIRHGSLETHVSVRVC